MRLSAGTQGARLWARADLRRRWRSLVVLGLLAGLSASLAIAALSGARRADTAFDRLRERTDGADAVVFPSQVAALHRRLVRAPRRCPTSPRSPRGTSCSARLGDDASGHVADLHAGQGRLAAVGRPADRARGPHVGPVDARRGPGRRGGRRGRTASRSGDQVPFTAFRRARTPPARPRGRTLELTVVGIIREPSQYLFPGAGSSCRPGTADRYGDAVERIGNSHVRLADPERDMARLPP